MITLSYVELAAAMCYGIGFGAIAVYFIERWEHLSKREIALKNALGTTCATLMIYQFFK